jgi:peptidoglycan/xylan/chitin deacetylase (PgdA/CDA1 family)
VYGGARAIAILCWLGGVAHAAPWSGGAAAAIAGAKASRADAQAHPVARPRLEGTRFVDGRAGPRYYVAFTFDDGPAHTTTPIILKALADYGLRATFFVCGYKFDGDKEQNKLNAKVLEDEVAAGHMIGSHTYHHKNLSTLKDEQGLNEIRANDRAIAKVVGLHPRLFRPPYGAVTWRTQNFLEDLGFTIVKWDIDAHDFASTDVKKITNDVLASVFSREGGVVILHDVKPATATAFPAILAGLQAGNCKRITAGKEPIVPVELDFFALGADGNPLPVPADVAQRATDTRTRIVTQCKDAKDLKEKRVSKTR